MNGVAPMLGKYILSFSNKLYSMLVPHNSNVVITYPYRLESCLRRHTLNTNTLMNIVKKATTISTGFTILLIHITIESNAAANTPDVPPTAYTNLG